MFDPSRRDPDELLDAWPTLSGVASAVAAAGVQCTVFQAARVDATRTVGGATIHFVAVDGPIPWLRGSRFFWRPHRLLASVTAGRADVLHVHGLVFPLQTAMLKRASQRTPLLVQDHATSVPQGLRRVLYQRGLRSIDGAAFCSRGQAEPFKAAGVLRPDLPIFEVTEGSSRFTPGDRDAARAASGLFGDPCLLWVGHLNENKDPLLVMEALRRAAPELTDPHLWLCYASGPLLSEVQRRMAADPVLGARVHLLGARPHAALEQYYRAADFFVSASHSEGSGYAAIEALSCATPILATDIPSLRVIAGNGAAGGLYPAGDAGALAGTLVAWWKGDRIALRQAARRQFEQVLSYEAIGRQLRGAYEALVDGS